ncbi:MAG: hypothetical protein QF880_04070 [Candidatus Poseidonia sp.]|nr:hypothetical protein [Poseidonia sp.]
MRNPAFLCIVPMRDVFTSPIFSPVSSVLISYAERIKHADLVHISAPATLDGVLALGQLEAACLDLGLKYRRRLYTPRHHLPRDAQPAWTEETKGLTVIADVEEATWEVNDRPETSHVHLVPLNTSIEMGEKNRRLSGALDPVVQAGALAAWLAPNGRRVRKMRPYISLGLWLRGALDASMDPVHTTMLNHLKEEGSVRIVPLPEVDAPSPGMIPGLSERQLKRLAKVWPKMDVDQRSLALSELILPCLMEKEISTPRLEELVWHRMVVGDAPMDLASQAHAIKKEWPEDETASKLFASSLLDGWLSSGLLKAGE